MNNTELIREIHKRANGKFTLKELDSILETMLQIMSERLSDGEEIQLADFGTFALSASVVRAAVKNRSKLRK